MSQAYIEQVLEHGSGIGRIPMVMRTFNAHLLIQGGGGTAPAQSAQPSPATTREAQAGAIPAPPTPPARLRTFVIRGRDGEQTITMPPASEIVPPQVVDISIAFFLMIAVIIIGLPLARAFARRMDRRSAAPQMPTEVSAQLAQLNQAVDAIALEVERISEGQRFTTRLLSEQRDAARQSLPSGVDR